MRTFEVTMHLVLHDLTDEEAEILLEDPITTLQDFPEFLDDATIGVAEIE